MKFLGKYFILLIVIVVFENFSFSKRTTQVEGNVFAFKTYNFYAIENYKGMTDDSYGTRNFKVTSSDSCWKITRESEKYEVTYLKRDSNYYLLLNKFEPQQKFAYELDASKISNQEVGFLQKHVLSKEVIGGVQNLNCDTCLKIVEQNDSLTLYERFESWEVANDVSIRITIENSTQLPINYTHKFVSGLDSQIVKVKYFDFKDVGSLSNNPFEIPEDYSIKPSKVGDVVKQDDRKQMKINDTLNIEELATVIARENQLQPKDFYKPKLLYFWFKSCYPCLKAKPHVEALTIKYAGANFNTFFINTDKEKLKNEIASYVDSKYEFPNFHYYMNRADLEKIGVYSNPQFILLDENNIIKYQFSGFDLEKIETLEEEIAKLLN